MSKYESLRPTVVCLDGGPCSGKSTVMEYLRDQEFEVPAEFIPEVATRFSDELLAQDADYAKLAARDRLAYLSYQERIVGTYIDEITDARSRLAGTGGVIVTDRGPAGIRSYVTEPEWERLTQDFGTTPEDITTDYADTVIFLASLAITDSAAYEQQRSTNPIRTETIAEARSLHYKSRSVWFDHPDVIDIDDADMERKQKHVAAMIGRIAGN
ncbi:MAG TPA: AAA family ATPase [Candidatus Saccharimonadales bacterium]|jgi:hypothetical protein